MNDSKNTGSCEMGLSPIESKKSSLQKTLKWILVSILIVIIGWYVWLLRAQSSYETALEKYKNAGLPISAQEFWPEIPKETNSAWYYEKAFIELSMHNPETVFTPNSSDINLFTETFLKQCSVDDFSDYEKFTKSDWEKFAKFNQHETIQAALSLIQQGNKQTKCRWSRDYNEGFSVLIPEVLCARQTGDYMLASMFFYSSKDKKQFESILSTTFLFAKSLKQSQLMMHYLIAANIEEKAYDLLAKYGDFSNENIYSLINKLNNNERLDISNIIKSEVVFLLETINKKSICLDACEEDSDDTLEPFGFHWIAKPYLYQGLTEIISYYYDIQIELKNETNTSYKNILSLVEKEGKNMNALTAMVFPNLTGIGESLDNILSKRKLLLLAIAIEKHKKEKGAFPKDISSFIDKKLNVKYTLSKSGYTITLSLKKYGEKEDFVIDRNSPF